MPSKSKETVQKEFLDTIKVISNYWANLPDQTPKQCCEGVALSILTLIDGCLGSFPVALDLVLRPHPDDKQYYIDNGEDYYEDGQVINESHTQNPFLQSLHGVN